MNPDLVIPPQFRRAPGDRDGSGTRRAPRGFSAIVEQDRAAHRMAAICAKLNQKARRQRIRARRLRTLERASR